MHSLAQLWPVATSRSQTNAWTKSLGQHRSRIFRILLFSLVPLRSLLVLGFFFFGFIFWLVFSFSPPWGEELSYATCFIYFTAPADAGCQAGVLVRFVCGFRVGPKQATRILQGHGRRRRQSGSPTAGCPRGGGCSTDTATPPAATSGWKKPENETGRLGKRKTTDWWRWKLKSLVSGSDNPTICTIQLDLHLAQRFIKPSSLMSQTSLSEVMLPWPLPLIIYSTVQLILLFFKMEL